MARVVVCRGFYATTPYYEKQIGKNLYSIEELCYFIRENACVLDKELMNQALVDWIDEELDFAQLARGLRAQMKSGASLAVFVSLIFDEIAYLLPEEKEQVLQLIRENAKLSPKEKGKRRADFLVKEGRYMAAIRQYETILKDSDLSQEFKSVLYYNIGICYAKMFLFGQALPYLEKAYRCNPAPGMLIPYLVALRMELSEEAYRDKVLTDISMIENSSKAEGIWRAVMEQWKVSEEKKQLDDIRQLAADGKMKAYYQKQEELVYGLKEEFRRNRQEA